MNMTLNDNAAFQAKISHVGLCVSDMERSLDYYCNGLGFTAGVRVELEGEDVSRLIGEDVVSGFSQFISLRSVAVELVYFDKPAFMATESPRPMNRSGFTHLSLRVPDVDAMAARLEAYGGITLASSRINYGEDGMQGALIFCLDPDGNRIELMNLPDEIQFY